MTGTVAVDVNVGLPIHALPPRGPTPLPRRVFAHPSRVRGTSKADKGEIKMSEGECKAREGAIESPGF